jgi:hypothetical protein
MFAVRHLKCLKSSVISSNSSQVVRLFNHTEIVPLVGYSTTKLTD